MNQHQPRPVIRTAVVDIMDQTVYVYPLRRHASAVTWIGLLTHVTPCRTSGPPWPSGEGSRINGPEGLLQPIMRGRHDPGQPDEAQLVGMICTVASKVQGRFAGDGHSSEPAIIGSRPPASRRPSAPLRGGVSYPLCK